MKKFLLKYKKKYIKKEKEKEKSISYPKYIIHKIQRQIHYNKENSQKKDFFPPVEKINKIKLNKNKSFTNHLYQSINIINYKKY